MIFIELFKEFWPYIVGSLASVIAWFTAKNLGRVEGERDALIKEHEERTIALRKSKEAHGKIHGMDEDDLRNHARKWLHDGREEQG